MKTIWIINQYASTPDTGMGGRHHHLAEELGRLGYDVVLVAARWHHLIYDDAAAMAASVVEKRTDYTFARIDVPRYAGAHDRRRVKNWMLFGWRIRQLPKMLKSRPDVILYSSPSLIGYLGAERLARRLGVKLVFEVRDIWPLSLVEIGGTSPKNPFIRWLQRIEDRAYRKADVVISNLPLAVRHMVERGMDASKFSWIPNGISLEALAAPEPLDKDMQGQLASATFKVGYVGTIGVANMLGTMVDAADLLRDHADIEFVIVGRGNEQANIEAQIASRQLKNVKLLGNIPKAQVQSALAKIDLCYIGLMPKEIFRFGVSPNKLFDYMIAAKPIIYAVDSGEYHPVKGMDGGMEIEPGNPKALAQAILKLKALDDDERRRMGERAHKTVLDQHVYATLAVKLADKLAL